MKNKAQRRKVYWRRALLWVGIIYATLYVVRPVCDLLIRVTPFSFLMNATVAVSFVGLVVFFWLKLRFKDPWTIGLLIFLGGCYAYGLHKITIPAEKIHFLQYGLLAYLLYRALSLDWSRAAAYVLACGLTFFFGWGDEAIQHLLPNRYYQFTDALLNGVSGALGLFFTFIIERARERS